MGTRGTSGFIYRDNVKLGYNHFDSYPSGLGNDIVKIIIRINKDKNGWNKFKKNIEKLKDLKSEDINDEIIERYSKYSDLGVSEQKYEDPYCLLRNIQSTWLEEVYLGNLEHFNFLEGDDYMGEYCYLINLDNDSFEFYVNSHSKQKTPLGDKISDDCLLLDAVPLSYIQNHSYVGELEQFMENYDENIINPRVSKYLKTRERKSKLENLDKKIINEDVL